MKNFHKTVGISSLLLIGVLLINYTLGQQLGNLDEIFPFLFMPPGITFAIARSAIYTGLIIAVSSRWSKRVKRNPSRQRISHLFWISCFFNAGRIAVTAMEEYAISVALLGCLLYVLYELVRTLKYNRSLHPSGTTTLPFSLYLGWISTAFSVIGISQIVHLGFGIGVTGTVRWTMIALACGILFIATIISKTFGPVGILPVFALVMIIIKNITLGNVHIAIAGGVGVCILGYVVWGTGRKKL